MPQSTYISETDPSGALLQDISGALYTNFDLSYVPIYGATYVAKNDISENVSDFLLPYIGAGSLEWPGVIAFDSSDNLYIANRSLANYISIANGDFIDNVYGLFTDNPNGMVFDSNNILWVTIANNNIAFETQSWVWPEVWTSKILKIDLTKKTQVEFIVSGISTNKLSGIVFDNSGNLFVTDTITSAVYKITITGETTGVGSIFASNFGGINAPVGIACDLYNNLYVCNSGNNNVVRIDPLGNITTIAAVGMDTPTGVTYNPFNNCLYVCNYGPPAITGISNRVFIFQIVNDTIYQIAIPFPPDGTNGEPVVEYYYSIATSRTGLVYTCGTTLKPDEFYQQGNGAFIKKLTQSYSGTNNVSFFTGGRTTINGNLVLFKYYINPVTSLALDTTQTSLYAAQFTAPWMSTTPTDNLYPPYPYGMIWKVPLTDPSYVPIPFYPIFDTILGPTSVAVDSVGNVYNGSNIETIVETRNKLLVTNTDGISRYVNITGTQVYAPSGLCFDNAGNLYVANYGDSGFNGDPAVASYITKLVFTDYYNATSSLVVISGVSIDRPNDMVIDSTSTNLYLCTTFDVIKIPISTGVASKVATTIPDGTKITSLALDAIGGVYYAGQVFDPFNQPITPQQIVYIDNTATLTPVTITGITLLQVSGIAFDNSGKLYISETEVPGDDFAGISVLTFSTPTTGTCVRLSLTGSATLYFPDQLAFSPSFNYLYTTSISFCSII